MLFWLLLIVASGIDIGAIWVLRHIELGGAARIAIALSPVPGNIALVALVVRQIRRLDEFKQRVHFEAVVIAFLMTGVSVFIYGFLETARAVPRFDLLFIWAFMAISHVVGYAISYRHYR